MSATASRAVVNGFLSHRVALTAKVRLTALFQCSLGSALLQHNCAEVHLLQEDVEVLNTVHLEDDNEVVRQGMDGVSNLSNVWMLMHGPLHLEKVELLPVCVGPSRVAARYEGGVFHHRPKHSLHRCRY